MKEIILALDNIRSIYNVGSLLRTADGLGIKKVYAIGLTPTPRRDSDNRLPHVINRVEKQLEKTALGAETTLEIVYFADHQGFIEEIKRNKYHLVAIEQDAKSKDLRGYKIAEKSVVVLGNEVEGVGKDLLAISDVILEIEMQGMKKSLNVSVAGALAMFELSK